MKILLFLPLCLFHTLNAAVILSDDIQKKENFETHYFYDEDSRLAIDDIGQALYRAKESGRNREACH